MSDNVIKIRLDSSAYESKVRRAAESIQILAEKAYKSGGALTELEKDEVAFIRSLGNMETVSKTASGKLRELENAYKDLAATYNGLQEEQKNDLGGKAMAASLEELKQRAQEARANFEAAAQSLEMPKVETTRTQLRDLTAEITDLTIQYRALTDEERKSPAGQEMARKIQEMTDKAGKMKDAMLDVQQSIGKTASDTRAFDQIAGAAQLATAGFQTFQGTAKLLGIQLGDNVEVIAKLQASMALTNSLTQIQNLLQKESAVMMGVSTVQTKAAAVAQTLLAKNTALATAAGKAFNLVAKANPLSLLVTGITAAVGAFSLLSKAFGGAADKAEELAKAEEEAKQKQEEYQNALNAAAQGVITNLYGKFVTLRAEWNNLSNEASKTEWIKENANAFKELGATISSIKDAEDVFVNNSQAMVDAIMLRAKAAVLTKRIEQTMQNINYDVTSGPQIPVNTSGPDMPDMSSSSYKYQRVERTAGDLNWVYEKLAGRYAEELADVNAQIDALMSKYKKGGGGGGGSTTLKVKVDTTESLTELQLLEDELKTVENSMAPYGKASDEWKTMNTYAEELREKIRALNGEFKELATGTNIQSESGISAFISGIKSDLEKADFGSALYNSLSAQLADMTTLQNLVTQSLKAGLGTALFDVADETGADFWTRAMEGGVENVDWQKIIDKINEELKKKGLDTIGIDFGTGNTKGGGDSKSKYQPKSIADATNTLVSSVSGIFTGIEQLGIELPKGFKDVIGGIQGIMSILTAINTILGVIEGLQAVQSLPFFARGGIVPHAAAGYFVPGNHFSGDATPIMADAGELILNKSSQNNLASLITEAESRGGASGVARVSGEQIWVALNAYTKRTGKGELVTWR